MIRKQAFEGENQSLLIGWIGLEIWEVQDQNKRVVVGGVMMLWVAHPGKAEYSCLR